LLALPYSRPLETSATRAWTDDFSDVLSALFRKLKG
jgi:hypothetical protein